MKKKSDGNETNSKEEENSNSLEQLVLYSSFFKFIASRLRRFQRTKVYILFFVIGLIFTLIFTSVILTFLNFSLFKIDPTSFNVNDKPSFLLFFYYSFNTIFSNQIHEIIPAASFSRILNMTGIFLGLIILAILATIYFSTKTQRYKEELNQMILAVDNQGNVIEKHITDEYSLSMDQALEELKEI